MAKNEESLIMKQFRDIKSKHPDAILLFRCGDFYEAYCEDAKDCAKILGITLTKNNKDGYNMAGFPHYALDGYLPKLIRAKKRVAICDILESPAQKTNNNNSNPKNNKIMAKKLQAVDLIGKTIVVVNNERIKYVVKSVDGDKLMTDFCVEGREPMSCPVPMSQVQTMVDAGTWKIEGVTTETKDEVEEVQDVQPQPAKTVDMKPKSEAKPKSEKPKAKGKGSRGQAPDSPQATHQGASPHDAAKLTYETYTNKKGKTCAKIIGFSENHPACVNCSDLHGSASYEKDKKGNKTFYLVFGPRYAQAAKAVCEALNNGKSLADCKAIIDRATEERQGKGYTAEDVAAIIDRVLAGEDIPEDIRKHIKAAA